MTFLIYFLIFIFGLIIGSFLNCLIYRLEKGEGFFVGRSYCFHCQHILSWRDLIPIFSFLILKGKCRYCSQKISFQYPLVELTTGIIFLSISNYQFPIFNQFSTCPAPNLFWCGVSNFPNFLTTIYLFLISCFLIVIFVYDLRHYIILDKIIYPAILVSGIWYFVSGIFFNLYTRYEILNTIYSAIGVAIFFLIIVLVSRGKWMGIGDVKLAALMGLFLGFPKILVALFLAFFLGAIIGTGLIISGKKTLKSEVPFGPFLVSGTFLALFFGQEIINWYLSII